MIPLLWIDYFQSSDSNLAEMVEGLIKDYNRAMICGIVLQEILQGIKDNRSYMYTKARLSKLPFLSANKETYIYASSLYRILRSKCVTIHSVDMTIAALSIVNEIPLFTRDKHFRTIAKHSELKLYNWK